MTEKQLRLGLEPKYSQAWHKYNLAKTNEKRLFIELLRDLVKIIKEPEYSFGRPPMKLQDMIFCLGLKLYSNRSGRKAYSDYILAKNGGLIEQAPHFNTLKDFLNCEATYDLLSKLLVISAIPVKKLEDQYSIDSSGFGTYSKERWNRVKWGKKVNFRDYLKGHILIGTKTNIICECEITPGNFSDVRQAPAIIKKASANFNMKEVSADKGYSSKLVYRIIQSVGSIPYIPFKHTTKEPTENSPDIWNQMFLLFRDNSKEWSEHYHIRSNVETTFSMVKRNMGEFLYSKNFVAQRNELMMKFICHNITVLIQEIYERNIKIDFDFCSAIYVERKVPEELITRDAQKVEN